MTVFEILTQLRNLDVKIWLEGDKLRYRAPQGALTASLRSAIAEQKAEILAFLREIGMTAVRPPLVALPRTGPLPLSYAQERLWFLDQWSPGSFAYDIPQAVRLTGGLDRPALTRGLTEVVRRHETLRTTFPVGEGGRPIQVIAPAPATVPLPLVDLTGLPGASRESAARALVGAEAQRSFDLARGPLLAAFLLRLDAGEHVLLLNLHHIISDGWSAGVLIGELGALYRAFVAGQPSPLPELPIQYADFAQWQRQWLAGETLAQQLAYWREHLAGAPRLLELPADRPRPPAQSFRGATLFFTLEAPLSQALRALAQREGATLFMLLLAAYDLLLGKTTGQEDLVLGTPIANRNQAEIEGLIGFFVNTLALRASLQGDLTFPDLLAQVREVTLGAYAHQDLPFEKLVEELKPDRDPSYTPIFQILVVLQNAPLPEIELPGLRLAPVAFDGGTAKFDLTLGLTDAEPELTGWIEYNTDLFDPTTIGRLLAHWRHLLAELAAAPERRLSELRLLSANERHQALTEWNDTALFQPAIRPSLSTRLREPAERCPDAVALSSAGGSLSYGALDRAAGALARRLRASGCGPGSRVAVALPRSPELVVALLGILRTGAAYVPLDPSYPKERLAFMLLDSRPAALLTQERSAARLPEPPAGLPVLLLDAGRLAMSEPGSGGLPESAAVQGDSFVYMIYTSGSTGQPKGALVRRRAFSSLVDWYVAELGLSADDRLLLVSSASFDLTQKNFFAPLLAGGELHLAPSLYDPAELRELVERHRITRINCTPSAFYPLAEEGDPAALATLRSVTLGGEPIALDRLDRWRRTATCRAAVINSYGPTECTDVVAFHRLAPPDDGPQGVPLGRPIPGVRLWIDDGDGLPAPIGVSGELWIGGLCVGGGYLGDPVRTAQKFLPDPWAEVPGARAYRTGDLARRLPRGEIDYLGRIDLQVKVRGFRIELGEIESRLAEHPAVREAAVAVRGEGPQARLVAYLVPQPGETPQPTTLRSFLLERLPESMVPNLYMTLEKLPLSPNGKLDRRQLPAPDATAGAVGAAGTGAFFAAPRTGTEEYLAGIWSEVLGVERVGAHDDFFDLGGHSMLAAQLVARLRGALAVEIPLRAFFDAPTLAGLAGLVDAARETGRGIENRPPVPVPREGIDLPLSYSQERLWLFERMVPGTPAYNNYRAARIAGPFNPTVAERAMNALLSRHEVLRTTYSESTEVDGRPVQIVHPHREQLLPRVDLTALPPETRDSLALTLANQDARIPVPLTVSPVLRATLLLLGPEDHVFILTLHHIVYDNWSGWVLLGDLEALYTAFRDGLPSPLPELPIQYADFAYWQRRWLEGVELREQLAYWRAQLAGAQPLELPTDRPRGARATHRGGAERLVLSGPLLGGLKALSRQGGATVFMTLLAAWNALFHREVGQGGSGDVPIGSPLANRTHSETEGLLGFFVNTAILRTRFGPDATFRELLAATREVALGAYAHQDLPFEKVIDETPPERRATLHELYRVVFAFIANYPALTRSMAGLRLTPLRLHSGAVHFDLTMLMAERDGGIHGFLEYSVDLFDGPTVARLLGRFHAVIAAGVADSDCAISSLPLLTFPERHQALLAWNDTEIDYPERPLVHERFTAHARRRPAATAIMTTAGDRRQLTYGEVEARSNRLAHFLRFLGVGPEVLVAICTERTLNRVVAIVAVLKAGGAYVSLDPTYPRERLAYLLEDSGAPVLLTEERFAPDLPESGARVIRLDADWDRVTGPEAYPPAAEAGPENLAYVVYTSGSTGKPKGVAIPHAGLTNLVYWHQGLYGVTAEDRGTQIASPAFDASIWELWPYLAAGASLHVPDEATRLSSAGMIRWWAEEGITLAYLMTPLAEGVLEEAIPEGLDLRVRSLIVGGDRLHRGPAPGVGFRLMNHYGPAEYTVTSTVVQVPPRGTGGIGGTERSGGLPTIGRAIDNTRLYVLDPRGELAPVGVPGELYVAGIGLARGYHRRPDLTAEKFVPAPWGKPGERMYKTGDLVRRLPDGDLDFLGRLDHQVKVRGLRIELGEIEAALGQHPGLKETAVLVREDRPGDRRLVAYVVPAGEPPSPTLFEAELRTFLAERLPAYMVPAAFVSLGAFPLTPNGKVDRRALPAPETGQEEAYVAPRGPVEELLAGIFAELLHRERVGVDESFFALGGHSLLAVQALSRVRRAFGVEPPIQSLFAEPTVAGLAREVAAALAAGRGAPLAPPLVPASEPQAGPPPLSFAQERLWLLDQLVPGSPAYNLPGAFRLLGRLDLPALAAGLREVVRRHAALRTRFAVAGGSDGRPVQVIAPSAGEILPFLPTIDVTGLPAASAASAASGKREALRLVEAEALRPFDLASGPLLRVRLLRLEKNEHLIFFSMHHIVSDAWSMGVLFGEIAALYGAFLAGQPSPLPELPIQYADFSRWQRQWLADETLAQHLAYWREHLAGAPRLLELPTDRPRPPVQGFRGASLFFTLEAPLSQALRSLAQREGATLFMLLLAACDLLLGKTTGQEDLVLGTPIANRNQTEIEGLIGFFVNTLALRADLSGDPAFPDLLGQVREVTLGAYAHQDLPFEKLVEELKPDRDPSYTPIFQTLVVLQNAPLPEVALPGLRLVPVAFDGGTAKFDLTLGLTDAEPELTGWIEYNTDLFDPTTAGRLLAHWRHLLAELAASPERRLSQLQVLGASERHQVVAEWNDTAVRYLEEQLGRPSLHGLVRRQVERTPDAVAVVFSGETLTYRALDRAAGALARRLSALGCGPESRVAVAMERSVELVVALLGILRAGAAYVPLDPDYPQDRLAFMLADARPAALLTQGRLAGRLPEPPAGLPVLRLDEERLTELTATTETAAGGDELFGDLQLAYMIYTSGSTGRPKGALVHHGAIRNRLLWMQDAYRLGAGDTVLQKTPFSFDVSVWEFFWPLLAGARLVLARPGGHREAGYLAELIGREGVTVLHFVPSMLQTFLDEADLTPCRALSRVVASGEVLGPELERRFFERLPETDLENLYGPTEAAVDVTVQRGRPGGRRRSVPIGRPIANTGIQLVDRELEPVPIGIAGELAIGGVNVGRGYLGRPELTAERFVPDPFAALADTGGEPGARLYKTGDLARTRPDGAIDYLGRIDHQVKLRGFRIELGEIESRLSEHPAVREAAVAVHGQGPEARLVAYLVPASGEAPSLTDLRSFLLARLPESMVPNLFMVLERLPLSPNGKLDRRQLPAPEAAAGAVGSAAAFVAPRSGTEECLAAIWSDILGIEKIGAHDDFFALGGHSLLGTQVLSRVRETLGVEISLRDLFEKPTVAGLAAAVAVARREPPLPPIVPVPRDADLPLSFAQQRLWFLDRLVPGSSVYNVPAAVRLDGALDLPALAASLNEIVRRHEALRTRFATRGDQPVQTFVPALDVTPPLLDLGGLAANERDAELRRLMAAEARRPFDLTGEPLLRVLLLRLDGPGREHVAFFTLHHIVSDAWSLGIFVGELAALYGAYAAYASGVSRERSSPLPELPVQYADFAWWQRQWLAHEVLDAQLAYWQERLRRDAVLELPTDRPRPPVQTFRGATAPLALDRGATARLRRLGRREGVTPFMLLLAAWQTLLWRYTGQDDIAVGSPVAGRTRREIEGLIGFFINTLVLRATVTGDPNFRDLLAQVRETALGAYAHQDVPFERLVEELAPQRDLGRSPLFQVVFALQNAPMGRLDLPGLTLKPVAMPIETAKFDLSLSLEEAGGSLSGALEHNRDLFDRTTAERMVAHLERLLAALAERALDPLGDLGRLSELPLLAPAEQAAALCEWNDAVRPCPQVPLVHQLFSQHARLRPEAPAITSPRGRLTYGELDARSNRLAHHLRGLGVGPEVRVAICTERTPERLVGIVAVLKAGGAYVSLDPTYPRERLAFLLDDSGAAVLLTEERFTPLLPDTRAQVIRLDADWDTVLGSAAEPSSATTLPDNLAYIVYTSGSTGKPKGVEIPHAGLMNLVRWHQRQYGVEPEDRGTQIASPAFDASIWELWPYLAGGASVHVPEEEIRFSSSGMLRWWAEQGITLAYLMTPLAEGVLEEPILPGLDLQVRDLIIGGDRLHRGPDPQVGFRLMNHYGPAEYSVNTTVVQVPPRGTAERPGGLPTIGRPVDNTWIYLLGQHGEPVPVGVPGELYVSGVGLARGYLGRPDLTAEKFLPDPFAAARGEAGTRMYRTADLVRRLPDGDLDFLGRLDHQVKIRGLRIELGEIETVLAQHPGLREAAVLVREDRPGDKRLVAYVVADGEIPAASGEEFKAYLAEWLPAYMVPAAFVVLDAFPLTPNGKVDRRALPAPQVDDALFLPPSGPVEELLAAIFAEVFERDRVGAGDDFFALGGHSLLAIQVLSRVRQAFGVEPSLRRLFELPTVAGLAAEIATLRRAAAGAEPPPAIGRVPRDRPLPLSFGQQRLWLLDRMVPGSPAYNIPLALRLHGELRFRALAAALGEIARRHESLRTTFAQHEELPVQVVAPRLDLTPPGVDLQSLPADRREAEVRRLADAEAVRPFDLTAGPLVRVALLSLRPQEQVALLTLHHIISDAWSMGVFVRELVALYGAFVAGAASPLPELPIQYADFAAWQRQWLTGERLRAQLGYWREKLSHAAVLELPIDRPRSPVQTFRGANEPVGLAREATASLRRLAGREGVTPFMLLLAAWQTLLWRYTGQDDLVVGSPVAGRTHREIEGLIGFFVNTLVLRTNIAASAASAADPTFHEILAQVREVSFGAYAHQDLPFERLVEELAPQRDLGRPPLFQVVFTLQNAPTGRLELPGLVLTPLAVTTETAKFDLTLSLAEEESGLAGALEYNRDLFDRPTLARMAAHLERILTALADPERGLGRLSELPLLAPAEQAAALCEWNDAVRPCPQVPLVHQLFSQHARLRPEAPAITSPRGRLTYGELDARSNRLAHHLAGLGVGPEVRVALCTERSPQRLVGIVAVLKAGGAYVSLDPTYPRERLAFLLDDSGAAVLLTEERFATLLPDTRAQVIRLDADWEAVHGAEDEPPAAGTLPDNLAYVVYTSGSTGKPKGVEIPHAGLMNLVRWHQRQYGVRPADRGTQIASPAFDASIWELWPYLAGGASVHVPEEEIRLSSSGMLRWWAEQGITLAYLMTPLAEGVLEESIPPGLDLQVRALIIGGDRLHRGPDPSVGFRLMNHYGPAEYSVTATVVQVPPRGTAGSGSGLPTIGRPVDNTWIYLLGQHGEPVPVGVPGELYLAGVGLARGYLGRPDLTAEKFLPDPFAAERGEAGARMYRTADLVRRLPDGDLDFLGRLDHQVKVRGLRIELGEIETVLGQHPALREAAVLVREDRPGDKRLVAYVVADGEVPTVSGEELKAYLAERLPAYMVPAAFVALDAFPLTPNGKVDRRALPAPQADGADSLPPRTPLELTLAGIWEELLDLRPIGVRDNFFALGGHSLLAVRLLTRIEERYGRALPLTELFRGGTVEDLALALTRDTPTPYSPVVPLSATRTAGTTGSRTPLFLVHPVGGGALVYRELAERLGPEQPAYGLQARGLEPGEEPVSEVGEMARTYLDAIRAVQPQGPYALAGWSFGGLVAFEMARRLEETGESARLILVDTQAPGLVPAPALDDTAALALFAAEAGLPWEEAETPEEEATAPLSRLATLAERAQLLPRGSGEAPLKRRLAVFKAHGEAARRYAPGPYGGRLTLLCAGESATPEAAALVERHPDYGWGAYAEAVDLHVLPGGHFSLLREPAVAALADLLRSLV